MIIDFHTHAFADRIAAKAIESLQISCHNEYVPCSDGTVSGLIAKMDEWGIDISVVQPVVTKQSQTKVINEWAAEVNEKHRGRIVCFGGIYPHTDDYRRDIDFAVSLGLTGLKFHAEYQNFTLDDPYMLGIYEYAVSKGLIILHHGGYDPAFPAPFKSSPKQFLTLAHRFPQGKIIAAHLGGHDQWEDVEHILSGSSVYLDTSMGFKYYGKEQFLRILKKHGADKILFASDSPWSPAGEEIEAVKSLPIPDEDKQKILGGNAAKLLNL
ncbi:amidohydrolase [Clostridia bacterium]|nr:amidohydrolase [Clostridia bacterium]